MSSSKEGPSDQDHLSTILTEDDSHVLDVNNVVQHQLAKGIQAAVNNIGTEDAEDYPDPRLKFSAPGGIEFLEQDDPSTLELIQRLEHSLDEDVAETGEDRLEVFMRQMAKQMAAMSKRIDALEARGGRGGYSGTEETHSVEALLEHHMADLGSFSSAPDMLGLKRRNHLGRDEDRKRVREKDSATPLKANKKSRKPELSRVVRATIFRMMGVSGGGGGDKAECGGYMTSPVLPNFESGRPGVWRWEWDKTIKQSEHNAAFALAVEDEILRDRQLGLHASVPEDDWHFLPDAVESAYTNLRREKEAQTDPVKRQRKEEHRRRIRKRALKEEKYRRRLKVFEDRREKSADESSNQWITTIFSSDLGSSGSVLTDITDKEIEDALDVKYMSSEDELDTHDEDSVSKAFSDATTGASVSLRPGERAFSVHRPMWRSQKIISALAQLDNLRPPERAFKRVLGEPRTGPPPLNTPQWMVEPGFGAH